MPDATHCFDSTGFMITVGSKVRFRGQLYTIKSFHPREGRHNIARIEFEEPQHTKEPADEWSVDRVEE